MRKLLSYFLVFTLIVTTVGVINVGADEKELKWNGFIYQVHNDTVANNKHVLIEDYVGTEIYLYFGYYICKDYGHYAETRGINMV